MSAKFHKFKLLLDENMPARKKFALLNRLFDVKHLAFDLRKGGLRDAEVYQEAVTMHRLIITFNGKDFKPMAANSKETGIIFVSQSLPDEQIDTKLVALLVRSSSNALFSSCPLLSNVRSKRTNII